MKALRCVCMILLLHGISGLLDRKKRGIDSHFSAEADDSNTCREPSDDCCMKSVYKYEDDWFPVYKLGEPYVPPYEANPEIPDTGYKTWQDYHERFYHMRPNFVEQFFEPYPIPFPVPVKTATPVLSTTVGLKTSETTMSSSTFAGPRLITSTTAELKTSETTVSVGQTHTAAESDQTFSATSGLRTPEATVSTGKMSPTTARPGPILSTTSGLRTSETTVSVGQTHTAAESDQTFSTTSGLRTPEATVSIGKTSPTTARPGPILSTTSGLRTSGTTVSMGHSVSTTTGPPQNFTTTSSSTTPNTTMTGPGLITSTTAELKTSGTTVSVGQTHTAAESDQTFSTTSGLRKSGTTVSMGHSVSTTTGPPQNFTDCVRGAADIVFLLDSSGSVGSTNFQKQKNFIANFAQSFSIGPGNVQIGVVSFASTIRNEFNLNTHHNKADMINAINNIGYHSGGTQTDMALKFVAENSFSAAAGDRTGIPNIVIVMTDGKSKDPQLTLEEATKLHQMNVKVFTIGIGGGVDRTELGHIATDDDHVFQVQDFDALNTALQSELKNTACKDIANETDAVCGSGAADIVFLLDSSGSVGSPNFQKQKDFVEHFAQSFTIGPRNVQIGVVTFATTVRNEFNLNTHNNKTDMVNAIKNVRYNAGGTKTDLALKYVAANSFSAAAGDRTGIPNILIILTDGQSNEPQLTLEEATKLHQMNVKVFAIGIGTGVDITELGHIATDANHVFQVQNFAALSTALQTELRNTACTDIVIETDAVCGSSTADIVFLLDSSGSVGSTNFQKQKDFVARFAQSFNIGPRNVRMGVVTFATTPNNEFNLNSHHNKADVVKAIKNIGYHSGGTQTDMALKYVAMNSFSAAAGDRAEVANILIVLTDGQSNEPQLTLEEANKLHQMNVKVFAVGIGAGVDTTELGHIATNVNHVFQVKHFDALNTALQAELKNTACIVCGSSAADIVFLLDSSGSVGSSNFQKQKDFIAHFAESFNIGPRAVQIGVVTFASSTQNEFNLNTHSNKTDLINAIKNIRYHSGGTKTDLALKYVAANSFNAAAGDRTGIANILIVMTDGKSADPQLTLEEANKLHQRNIKVFAIGIGAGVDRTELGHIATDANHVFPVQNFDALNTALQAGLKNTACKVFGSSAADIVFLLDSSRSVGSTNFQKQKDFIARFAQSFHIGPRNVQIGVMTLASTPHNEFYLNTHNNKADMVDAIKNIRYNAGGSQMDLALNMVAANSFSAAAGDRTGVGNILIVMTNGKSNETQLTLEEATKLHQMNVKVFTIGIGAEADKNELSNIATDANHLFQAQSFDALNSTLLAELKSTVYIDIAIESDAVCGSSAADIVFLLDSSGSIGSTNFQKQKDFVAHFAQSFNIGPRNVQIGVVTFASSIRNEFNLNTHNNKTDIVDAIKNIRYNAGGTKTDMALKYVATNSFSATAGDRTGVPNILIVVTDGQSNDPQLTLEEANELHKMNVKVFAIGIGTGVDKTELGHVATDATHVFEIQNFDALDGALQAELRNTACIDIIIETDAVCGSSAADIVFLLDSSGSVGSTNFQKQKDFVADFAQSFNIGPRNVQIGVVAFASKTNNEFNLNTHHNKVDMVNAIKNIGYHSGGTQTDMALKYVAENSFSAAAGDRTGIANILIVVTDGKSSNPQLTLEEATKLHQMNVKVFTIGIGTGVDKTELANIASSDKHVFQVQKFDALNSALQAEMKNTACIDIAIEVDTVCGSSAADIVFLLDTSGSVGPTNFQKQKDFIVNFAESFNIGPRNVQIGVVTFASTTLNEFNLNTHHNKTDLVNAIKNIGYRSGGTRTDLALKHVADNSFKATAGDRAGIPNILIVVTDGQSNEPQLTLEEANKLHQTSIQVFAIGIGVGVDRTELGHIATDANHVFPVQNFDALNSVLQSELKNTACIDIVIETDAGWYTHCTGVLPSRIYQMNALVTAFGSSAADIVILLDSSGSVGPTNFLKQKNFVADFVQSYNIGPRNVQIGVCTFSSTLQNEFNLNTHHNKADMINAIKNIGYSPGGNQMDLALKMVATNSFNAKAGDRTGVANILIVVTNGKSNDPQLTLEEANILHQMNVKVFVIGIGAGVDSTELGNIATDANHVFQAQTFDAINSALQAQLKNTINIDIAIEAEAVCGYSAADIVFLLDSSGSVGSANFQKQKDFVARFAQSFTIGPRNVQIGVVTFASSVHNEFNLNTHNNKTATANAIKNIGYHSGGTRTDLALKHVAENSFKAAAGNRAGVPNILIVMTDGQSNYPQLTVEEGNKLHQMNVKVFAIGIGVGVNTTELGHIATDATHLYQIQTFDALNSALQTEMKNTACIDIVIEIDAVCGSSAADIVFLLDSSGSVGQTNFQKQKDFVADFAQSFNIGPRNVRIGVVTFATTPHNEFNLNTYHNKADMVKAINNIEYHSGGTQTDMALKYVAANSFNATAGDRTGVANILIVMTDGLSSAPQLTLEEANKLHQMNVKVFAIGIGTGVDKTELGHIATNDRRVFQVQNFDELNSALQAEMKNTACMDIAIEVDTVCSSSAADIVFLLDSSGSVGPTNFQNVKDFVAYFAQSFNIGPRHVRIGVVTFASTPHNEFNLNIHHNDTNMVSAIKSIGYYSGGTRTDLALKYVDANSFTPAAGDRAGVANMLIVVTDGQSNVPRLTLVEANKLHQMNVKVFTIGIGTGVDKTELGHIATDANHVFQVQDFDALNTALQSELKNTACIVCGSSAADIVFLLDSSGSVGSTNFQKQKDFVADFAQSFNIGPGNIQIGVVTFASTPHNEFNLDTHHNKVDMLDDIKKIGYYSGGTRTDLALKYVDANSFNATVGDREGVTNMLIVITDGQSNEPQLTLEEANKLHQMNVKVFAIGIGAGVDQTELGHIATDVKNVFQIQNFDALNSALQAELKNTACTEIPGDPTTSSEPPSDEGNEPPSDDGNNTAQTIGAAVGAIAAIGCVAGVIGIVFKIRAKLAAAKVAGGNSSGTNGSAQSLLSRRFNSVAPSSYEPALNNVHIPDAPQSFGYDGADGLGGPADYMAPPLQQPQGPNIPRFNRYTMAGQEPPIPGTPGTAGYEVEPIVDPATYDAWFGN